MRIRAEDRSSYTVEDVRGSRVRRVFTANRVDGPSIPLYSGQEERLGREQMGQTTKKIDRIRRLARDIGVPLDSIESIAISVPRAARLIDVQARTLRKALHSDGVRLIRILGTERLDVIDFVEFLERRKRDESSPAERQPQTWDSLSAVDRAALTRNE